MNDQTKPEPVEEATYMVFATGEAYEMRICAESDIVATIDDLYYHDPGMCEDAKAQWQQELDNPANWELDNQGRKTEFSTELPDGQRMVIFLKP